MSVSTRRVILIPRQLGPELRAQLAARLEAAIEAQKQLADRSPHILQLVGSLQEDAEYFFVEHEPAEAIPLPGLFDPRQQGLPREELWRITIAVLDALRAAHGTQGRQPITHGAVCPGVLVRDLNGVEKLTDFGFAQAVAETLGEQAYVNLAVRPPLPGMSPSEASGIWEILDPQTSDRDDRICAFIDPEKYASGLYRSFERTGDIVAAGILIYLLSEHRHPYFYDEPAAVRNPELAEAMSFGAPVPFNTLRDEFRDSDEPAVKVWRELLWGALERIPQGRPSAAEMVKRLAAVGIRPIEGGDIFARRLETLAHRLARAAPEEHAQGTIAADLRKLASATDAPDAVKQAAAGLVTIAELLHPLTTDTWHTQARLLIQQPLPPALPDAILGPVQQLRDRLSECVEIHVALNRIEEALGRDSRLGPTGADAAIRAFQAQQTRLAGIHHPPPTLTSRARELWHALAQRRAEVDPDIEHIRGEADRWLAELDKLARDQAWDRLEEKLKERDHLPVWLLDLDRHVERYREQIRWQRLRQQEKDRLREELRRQIQEASQRLAAQDPAGAMALLEPVAQQSDLPDLADQARTLYARVAEQQAALAAQQEKLRQARQRAESLLLTIEKTLYQPLDLLDEPTLSRTQEVIDEVLEIPGIPEALLARARELTARRAQLSEEILRRADENVRQLERQEQDLARAASELEQGHVLKARIAVELLAQSEFANIAEAARKMLERIDALVAGQREALSLQLDQAEQAIAERQWDRALSHARGVLASESADLLLRERAEKLIRQTEALREEETRAREALHHSYEELLGCFQAADLPAARRLTDALLSAPHADAALRAAAREIHELLIRLEQAQALIEEGRFPEAVQACDRAATEAGPGSRIIEPAMLLRQRARNRQAEVLIAGLRKHLRHRAEKPESRPDPAAPGDSRSSFPDWLRARLDTIDDFLQDLSSGPPPASAGPPLAPGDRLGDKYEIIELIGRGGMGEVYRARDLDLDREVALKLTPEVADNPALSRALEHEARAIARLRHPHIMHINSSGVIDGRRYFDTNYIRGKDLAAWAREHRLSQRAVAEVLIPVAEALDYAHQQNLLHRDIKPQNIYMGVEPGEGPWLIDFGLAYIRSITDPRRRPGLCGTPGYIAPEVITSMGEQADHRSDIFAMGCVLYELLAGRPPFQETPPGIPASAVNLATVSQTLLNTLRGHCRPLARVAPEVRPELARICEKAMAEEPANRYDSAAEMAAALRSFLKTLDIEEAEADLRAARSRFEERRVGTPQEPVELQEALKLAENVRHHGIPEWQNRARELAEEIRTALRDIAQRVARARTELRAAAEAHHAGDHAGAVKGAQAVLANPYAAELHPEARKLIEKARESESLQEQERRKQQSLQRKRSTRIMVAAAVLLLGAGGVGYLLTDRRDSGAVPSAGPAPQPARPALPSVIPQATLRFDEQTIRAPDGKAVLTIDLSEVPQQEAVLDIVCRGTAEHGRDFRIEGDYQEINPPTAAPYTIRIAFPAGVRSKFLTLRTNGEINEPRTLEAELADMKNVRPGSTIRTMLTLNPAPAVEPPPAAPQPILSLKADRNTIEEKDPAEKVDRVIVTIRATGGKPADGARARIELSSEQAVCGRDYVVEGLNDLNCDGKTAASGTIDLTGGSNPATFTLKARDNAIDEGDRTVEVKIASAEGAQAVTDEDKVVITIRNDDQAGWLFTCGEGGTERVPGDKSILDEGQALTCEAHLKTEPAVLPVTLRLPVTGEGVSVVPAALTFDNERPWDNPQTFTVKTDDDLDIQGDRQATINIAIETQDSKYKSLNPPPLTVQVNDDDAAVIAFAKPGLAIEASKLDQQKLSIEMKSKSDKPVHWADPVPLEITVVGRNQQKPVQISPDGTTPMSIEVPLRDLVSKDLVSTPETTGNQAHMVTMRLGFSKEWQDARQKKPLNITLGANTIFVLTLLPETPPPLPAATQPGPTVAVTSPPTPPPISIPDEPERARVERRLPTGEYGKPVDLDPAQAWSLLREIAAIKWKTSPPTAIDSLGAWTEKMRVALKSTRYATDNVVMVEPQRFVEFFWGPEHVHAIYWYSPASPGGPPARVRYVRLGGNRELADLVKDTLNLKEGAINTLGPRIWGPITGEEGFFISEADSFGVVVAPDGPLCFLPMAHLPFTGGRQSLRILRYTKAGRQPQPITTAVFSRLANLTDGGNVNAFIAVWTMVSTTPAPNNPPEPALLWEPWWNVVSGPNEKIAQFTHLPGKPSTASAVFVYGPAAGITNPERDIGSTLSNSTFMNNMKNLGLTPDTVDGGFLNPRLNLFEKPPGRARFCVIVSSPVSP